jgi:hypothetical protein
VLPKNNLHRPVLYWKLGKIIVLSYIGLNIKKGHPAGHNYLAVIVGRNTPL